MLHLEEATAYELSVHLACHDSPSNSYSLQPNL